MHSRGVAARRKMKIAEIVSNIDAKTIANRPKRKQKRSSSRKKFRK